MGANDFISLMVQETLDSEQSVGEKVLPYQSPDCFEVEAIYNEAKKCYLICADNKFIEIPKNWGPFKNRISQEFILLKEDDHDLFLDIISTFFQKNIECMKIQLINSEVQVMRDIKSAA